MKKGIWLLAIPIAFLVSGWMVPTGAKPTKGKFFDSAMIVDAEKGKLCRPDSGLGQVVSISYPHENPLFPSKSPNTVNLLLHFKNGMTAGKKFTLPDPDVSVCYFEKGDLLMFHTFEGVGSIHFDPVGGKKEIQTGKMDLKLVRPHHNMSNSDYHYMGGRFSLSRSTF